jgi:hypothetical protein
MSEISASGTANMKSSKKLLWIGHACLLVSVLAMPVVTYFHPLNIPFHGLRPIVWPHVWLLVAITIYAWIWPTPGGAMAMLYGFFEFLGLFSSLASLSPIRSWLVPAYFLLTAIFLAGGFLHIITGARQPPHAERISYPESRLRRVRWAARLMTVVALVAFIVFFYPDHGLPWIIFGGIPAVVMIGIAWFRAKLGGALLVAYAIYTFFFILGSGMGFETKLVLSVMWAVFLAGGILFAYLGKRQGKH